MIEVRVDSDLNLVMAVVMVRCGQTDCGHILKVGLTGFANKFNAQFNFTQKCEK